MVKIAQNTMKRAKANLSVDFIIDVLYLIIIRQIYKIIYHLENCYENYFSPLEI